MKKLALILALLIIPVSAFGLEMLNDSALEDVTGQSGVSIAFDDIEVFLDVDRFSYIDCDGLSTSVWGIGCGATTDQGAAINVNGFQLDTLKLNAIIRASDNGDFYSTSCGDVDLQFDYTSDAVPSCRTSGNTSTSGVDNFTGQGTTGAFQAQAISIDVTDTLPALTEGKVNNNLATGVALGFDANSIKVAGIAITLPTFEAYIDVIQIDSITVTDNVVTGAGTYDNDALNSGASFGAIEIEGVTFSLLNGGWIEIAPHD